MNIDFFSLLIGWTIGWIMGIGAFFLDYKFKMGYFYEKEEKAELFVKPNLLTNRQVNKYVSEVYPDWKWQWTTVDQYGYPQILLTKEKSWKLLSQIYLKTAIRLAIIGKQL